MNQLHPGSPILALKNSVANQQPKKWTKKLSITREQPVKLWKLSDAETIVRKREGWWSKGTHYPERRRYDHQSQMTIFAP